METLGKHFQSLSKAAFARYGFGQSELLSNWPVIAGDDMANICKPEKIKWPRRNDPAEKGGGTLVLRASPGRSLDVQYQAPKLINRINQFFGYEAVVALKVMHATDGPAEGHVRPRQATPTADILAKVATITDTELQQALARLGANIAVQTRSPQPK